MKRNLTRSLAVPLILILALAGSSCKKKEEPAVKEPQVKPEVTKQVEQQKKNLEDAKTHVIAKVNGSNITMYNLVHEMNALAPRYISQGQQPTPELSEKIKKEALNKLIFEELAVQEAVKKGINVKPETIEDVAKKVRTHLGSDEAYKMYLDKFGFTDESFRKQIERGHRFETVLSQEIYGKIKIDEKRIKDAYEKEKSKFVMPEKFIADDVYFTSGKDDEDTRKKAKEVLSTLKKNNGDLAKLGQDKTLVLRRIPVNKNEYPLLYTEMTPMKPGDLSGVVKEGDGLHIIKVVAKEPSRPMTYEEARKVIHRRFMGEEGDKKIAVWDKELRKTAKIEVMLEEVEKKLREAGEKKAGG